jgi:hypothetical protein
MSQVVVINVEGIWHCVGAVLEVQEMLDGDGVFAIDRPTRF